jgi:hypothetical protein
VLGLFPNQDQRSDLRPQVSINKQTQRSHAQLYGVTLDNTSSNNTLCQTIERLHTKRGLTWSAEENQLPWVFFNNSRCLAHVVNLGNVAVMDQITKVAAVETTTAIWEYDPTLDDNRVLGGSLDVIAAIRTLAIKVRFYRETSPVTLIFHCK